MLKDLQFYNSNISNVEIEILKQALRLYVEHDRYYLENFATKQQVIQEVDQLISDINQFRKYAKIKNLTNQNDIYQHKIEHLFAILSVSIGTKINNWEQLKQKLIEYRYTIQQNITLKYITWDQFISKYKQIEENINTKQPYKIYKQIIEKL